MTQSIEQRLAALERQNRTLRRGGALLFVGAGLAVMFGALGLARREPAPKVIEAQCFNLVDEEGHVRATLLTSDHGPRLRFKDKDGKDRASIGHNDGMGPFLGLLDKDEKGRIQMTAVDHATSIQVLDDAHVVRADLGQSASGVGLYFSDSKGKDALAMAAFADSTGFKISDPDGHTRVSFGYSPKESFAIVMGPDEKWRTKLVGSSEMAGLTMGDNAKVGRAEMVAGAEGAGMKLRDEHDKTRVSLVECPDCAALHVSDGDEVERATFGYKDKASAAVVYDETGNGSVLLLSSKGQHGLSISDDADVERIRLATGPDREELLLKDSARQNRVNIYHQSDQASVVLTDAKEDRRVMLSQFDGGTGLYLGDKKQPARATLVSHEDFTSLQLSGATSDDQLIAFASDNGPGVGLKDVKGKMSAAMMAQNDRPAFVLYDRSERPTAFMESGADGGKIAILDKEHKPILALPPGAEHTDSNFPPITVQPKPADPKPSAPRNILAPRQVDNPKPADGKLDLGPGKLLGDPKP